MREHIPTTEYVREAYSLSEWSAYSSNNDEAVPEFDRWLAGVKAEAWDEGLDAGRYRWMDGWEFGDKPVNPYRGEQA